jgi:hypothetical protein
MSSEETTHSTCKYSGCLRSVARTVRLASPSTPYPDAEGKLNSDWARASDPRTVRLDWARAPDSLTYGVHGATGADTAFYVVGGTLGDTTAEHVAVLPGTVYRYKVSAFSRNHFGRAAQVEIVVAPQ